MICDKQVMPCRQQKSAKKGSETYLMFGPNHILVTLRSDDGRSPVTKMFKMEFKFSKLVKSIVFRRLRDNQTVRCSQYNMRFALRTRYQGFVKKNEKKSMKKMKIINLNV